MMQEMVREFHEAFGLTVGNMADPKIVDGDLRCDLLEEETEEFVCAVKLGDLPGAVDALCDVIYVALGAAVTFGVDLAPVFAEVHRSNMAKVGGPVREDGKKLKPEGWKPPDVAGLIQHQVDVIAEVRRRLDDAEEALKNR